MHPHENPFGYAYGIQFKKDNNFKSDTAALSWRDTFLLYGVVLLIVIFFSWMLALIEAQYINHFVSAAQNKDPQCSSRSVSRIIYQGYVSDSDLRETFFKCKQGYEEVSFWDRILGIKKAVAADYEAKKLIDSGKVLEMQPGETKTYTVGFKNTGSVTWTRDSGPYISIYTHEPKYRTSDFQDSSWRLREQPTKITQAEVKPGELAFVTWKFHAPEDIEPGWYTEYFYLAAEDLLWIPGGFFYVKIWVDGDPVDGIQEVTRTEEPPKEVAEPQTNNNSTEGYGTKLLLKSHHAISANAGQTIEFTAGFKNYGSETWTNEKITSADVSAASSGLASFFHDSWSSQSVALESNLAVAPGHLGFFKFKFRAPSTAGLYNTEFHLVANGVNVPGGEINIPVTVTDDGGYVPPETSSSVTYGDEPIIRVGLYDLEDDLTLTSDKSYQVRTSCGDDLGTYSAGVVVATGYDKSSGEYYFSGAGNSYRGSCYIRFTAVTGQNVFELTNYEKRPAWNRAYNDNKFRGVIEIRVSDTGYPWVINELPMEDYLKGLAETSDYSPVEFQKALATAARSYAYHHWENPYKHAKGHFTVDATYDQVYRGYNNEIRIPRFASSVEATRGEIVHYENEPVFTPYYSRSDGRTRSYREVWGRDYGWLLSVAAPYDAANENSLWGHGVGMACTDAIGMANDGKTWREIINYYYTNITLKKIW